MEDKNLNPGTIPEDMPALDLDHFENQPQTSEALEPLFREPPIAEEAIPSVDLTVPQEDTVIPDAPSPESIDEVPDVSDSPVEAVVTEENGIPESGDIVPVSIPELPADEPVTADTKAADARGEEAAQALPAETGEMLPEETELPARNFSEFDVPMDEPAPELPVIPEPAVPEEISDNTVVFDLNLPESTANTDGMEQPYQDQPMESAAQSQEEAVAVPEAPTPAPGRRSGKPVKETSSVRKARPKSRKGDGLFGIPHLLATLLWLAIIVAIGVSLGRMLWLCASDVLAFGRESKEVVITIETDDTIDDIAEKLHEKGLIKYPGLFKIYADIAVDDGEIAPGTYTLDTILDYHALVSSMSSSSSHRAVVEDVLIPEGYSCRQIFELLEQNGICTVAELEAYAANGVFQDFWFLEGVARGDKYCLEGFLFPDTYDFYANSTPREALGKMLLGFNSRIDQDEITERLTTLNERLSAKMKANGCSDDFIAENQITLYELLTVASLIEEETAGASESPNIASVIYNRLTENEVYERYLGIDAAIIYATGDAENVDTSIDSPYNTYTNAGLTPTPISNPGLSSINAALDFAETDYYYYVLNPETQLHQFSKTYEEHQEWIEKFRGE